MERGFAHVADVNLTNGDLLRGGVADQYAESVIFGIGKPFGFCLGFPGRLHSRY